MHGGILPVKQFIAQRWFLTKLERVLLLERSFSSVLQPLSDLEWLQHAIVAGVIIAITLPIGFHPIGDAIRRPIAVLLATAINFAVLP